jgi:hypothetical protein
MPLALHPQSTRSFKLNPSAAKEAINNGQETMRTNDEVEDVTPKQLKKRKFQMQNKTHDNLNNSLTDVPVPSEITGYVKGIKGKILESEFKSLR